MNEGGRKLDWERLSLLRNEMSDSDLEQLEARSKADLKSLTLDEAGILFLGTRLTNRWSGRVNDKVPSSNVGVRAAQLNR